MSHNSKKLCDVHISLSPCYLPDIKDLPSSGEWMEKRGKEQQAGDKE